METLKIEIPEGYMIDSFDKVSGQVKFKAKPKDVLERIKTIPDALRELGEQDEQVIIYRKLLTQFDASCHIVNYQLAVVIIRALNEKREPDWDDSSKVKYSLWFIMASSGFRSDGFGAWRSGSNVGSRLCFMEKRLGLHAVEQPEFMNVFKLFMTIQK